MKKALLFIAIGSAFGGASAQVSITGTLSTGYRAGSYLTVNTTGLRLNDPRSGNTLVATMAAGGLTLQDASGLGVDTSEINFNFSEDLGGGTKILGKMGVAGADRSGANPGALWSGATPPTVGTVGGGDAQLTIAGRMGALTLSTTYLPDYVTGGVGGTAQVGGVDMSGKVSLARALRDAITYTLPVMPGWTLQLAQAEANGLPGLAYPNPLGAGVGLGLGSSGASTAVNQRQTAVALTYASGPMVLNAQYISADNRYAGRDTSIDNVCRVGANYDFGVVKLGLAVEADNTMTGQLLMSNLVAALPLGALKLSANYTVAQTTGLLTTVALALQNGKRAGTGIAAEYALSKSTKVIANYASWEQTVGAVARNNEANVLLSYAF